MILAFGVLALVPSAGGASVEYGPPYLDAQTFERCSQLTVVQVYSCTAEAHSDKATGALSGTVAIQPEIDSRVPGLAAGYAGAQIQVGHPVASGSLGETVSATIHVNMASVAGPEDGHAAFVAILFGAQYQDRDACNCYAYRSQPIVQTNDIRSISNEDFTVTVTVGGGGQPLPEGTLIITAGLYADYGQGLPFSPTQALREHSASAQFDAVVTQIIAR